MNFMINYSTKKAMCKFRIYMSIFNNNGNIIDYLSLGEELNYRNISSKPINHFYRFFNKNIRNTYKFNYLKSEFFFDDNENLFNCEV